MPGWKMALAGSMAGGIAGVVGNPGGSAASVLMSRETDIITHRNPNGSHARGLCQTPGKTLELQALFRWIVQGQYSTHGSNG